MFPIVRDNFRKPLLAAFAAMAMFAAPLASHAQYRMDALPPGAGADLTPPKIVDKAGTQLPLDDQFTTADGKSVTLGDFFNHGKPVIVSMVYFSCPLLCGETQRQIAQSVVDKPGGLEPGKDYDIVVVSIDPDDTPAAAKQKQAKYRDLANLKPDDPAITYLVGKQDNIDELAQAIGFNYKRNFGPVSDKFVHQPGIFICTPEGKLSHTIAGLVFDNKQLYESLQTASHDKIGNSFVAFAICCGAMKFNPLTGHYELNPYFWVGTATGLVTLLTLGGFLTMMWRTEARVKAARAAEQTAGEGKAPDQPDAT
ncbi:MAG: SCO family protein [Phycisphaerae bacterium]